MNEATNSVIDNIEYEITSGYLIWIIVSRLRMNKRFGKIKIKDGEENHGEEI